MAQTSEILSQQSQYWKVTGSNLADDGTFDVSLVQVKDFTGAPTDVAPMKRTVNRNVDVARGTIVKVVETITRVTDRVITANPTS